MSTSATERATLEAQVRVCVLCTLAQTRKLSVPGEGPAPAPVMLGMAGDTGGGGGDVPIIPAPSTAGVGTIGLAVLAGLAAFYLTKK